MGKPGSKPFEVSEMQIFCEFEGLCKQLEKVQTTLTFYIWILLCKRTK